MKINRSYTHKPLGEARLGITACVLTKVQDVCLDKLKEFDGADPKRATALLMVLERAVALVQVWVHDPTEGSVNEDVEWQKLKTRMILCLEPYPEALEAVKVVFNE